MNGICISTKPPSTPVAKHHKPNTIITTKERRKQIDSEKDIELKQLLEISTRRESKNQLQRVYDP